MKKLTSGEIYEIFKQEDEETIIRRTNIRSFCKQARLKYTICQGKWLIDFNNFVKMLNPKNITSKKTLPRLRTKISLQRE